MSKKGLCFSCENARRTWSDALMDDGYCGCCALMFVEKESTMDGLVNSIVADIVGKGWIRPSRGIDSVGSSGGGVNGQLVTKNVSMCPMRKVKHNERIHSTLL